MSSAASVSPEVILLDDSEDERATHPVSHVDLFTPADNRSIPRTSLPPLSFGHEEHASSNPFTDLLEAAGAESVYETFSHFHAADMSMELGFGMPPPYSTESNMRSTSAPMTPREPMVRKTSSIAPFPQFTDLPQNRTGSQDMMREPSWTI